MTHSGFLLIDKPRDVSSGYVVGKIKRKFSVKVGHTGTLDPLAQGMLVLCVNEATKFAQYNISADKHYTARVELSMETDSCDTTGKTLRFGPPPCYNSHQIQQLLHDKFTGCITQMPPLFSALKYQGKPYYYYARRGLDIPISSRDIQIRALTLTHYETQAIELDVLCSSGTYIRSLARDIGLSLKAYGCLSALRRNYVQPWQPEQMYTLEQAMQTDNLVSLLQPIDSVLSTFPSVHVTKDEYNKLSHGQYVMLRTSFCANPIIKVYTQEIFCGLISKTNTPGLYKPLKMIRSIA